MRAPAAALFLSVTAVAGGCRPNPSVTPTPMPPTIAGTWRAGLHAGVNHAHIHEHGRGYGSAVSAQQLDALAQLGINAVAVTPFAYQDGATATVLAGYPPDGPVQDGLDPTLRAADVAAEVRQARARGMTVMVKPHLWSRDFWNGGAWPGTIHQETPEGHARWWRSYRAYILHHAAVAQEAGAQWFCLGNELRMVTAGNTAEWTALAADVRKVFRGKLTYAAHWDGEFEAVGFWDVLDAAGINAYFPLDAPDTADVATLRAAWEPHVRRVEAWQARVQRPVLFTEVGYRAVAGAWRRPWEDRGGTEDGDAQARAYQALLTVFSPRTWWNGFYAWKTFTDPSRASPLGDGDGFSFRARPAEHVLRAWLVDRR